jgi:hypothetical protein
MSCVSRRSRSLRSVVRDWRSFNEIYTSPSHSLVCQIQALLPDHPPYRIHTFLHSRTPEERAAIRLALDKLPATDTAQDANYLSLISSRRFRTEYRDTLNCRFVSGNPRSVAQSGLSAACDIVVWLKRGLAFVEEREKISGSEYSENFHSPLRAPAAKKEAVSIDQTHTNTQDALRVSALEQELARLMATRRQPPFNQALEYTDHDSMLEEHYFLHRPELRQSEYFAFTKTQSLAQMEKKVNLERKVKHALRFAQHVRDLEGVKMSIGP